jgi:hypothetical protein
MDARRQHDDGVGRQSWEDIVPQRRGQRVEPLEGVHQDHRLDEIPGGRDGLGEGLRHRLDLAAVDGHDRMAGPIRPAGELPQQRTLADPARAVDPRHRRGGRIPVEQALQAFEQDGPTGEPLLVEHRDPVAQSAFADQEIHPRTPLPR